METVTHLTFTRELLERLIQEGPGPKASIYLPTIKMGSDTRQNSTRYKNLITELSESTQDRAWLDALHALQESDSFWQSPSEGLAILSTPQKVEIIKLPYTVPELATVGRQYRLLPLFPYLSENTSFFILKVNLNAMQLLIGSRYGELTEVPIDEDVFTSLQEYQQQFEGKHDLQFHTTPGSSTGGGRGAAIFHGQGDISAEEKTEIRRFFEQYQHGIFSFITKKALPVVLVGVQHLLPVFREVFSPHTALQGEVAQQPESLSDSELLEKAGECVASEQQNNQMADREAFLEQRGTKQTSPFLSDIIPLAREGRVRTLFIQKSAQEWGLYDPVKNEVHLHTEQQPNSEPLWETAAQFAFLTNARVQILEEDDSLLEAEAGAALLRY